jgi:hypothetical protein
LVDAFHLDEGSHVIDVQGNVVRNCDGIARRTFLRAGTLGMGAFAGGAFGLADLLRAEERAGIGSSSRAIVHVHLDGGPPQLDTIDLKPRAPIEIRGEFAPIATAVPGFGICELLPKLATLADRFAWIRTLTDSAGRHDGFQCQSGFHYTDLESLGGRPALGSVVSKLLARETDPSPPYVDMMQGRALVRNSARAGFLGPSFKPFRPDMDAMFERPLEAGMMGERARLGENATTSLVLDPSLDARRLGDRTALRADLDRLRRDADGSGMMDAMDRFSQQAIAILTSGRFAEAMDLAAIPEAERRRYVTDQPVTDDWFATADRPSATLKFLLARRLLEAGVRVVSLSISDFDTHRGNFTRMRQMLPFLDHGLATFVTDLEERGMLDNVTIVCWGEFGRTPKTNDSGGRDHWPRVGPCWLAGGGLNVGQVIGETDRTASTPIERPVTYKDVFATLYRQVGLDPHAVTLTDPTGRPQYLLDAGTALPELG